MTFKLEFDMDSAPFAGNPSYATSCILQRLSVTILLTPDLLTQNTFLIRDGEGSLIGKAEVVDI
jgi:hypothetical protein